jgi:hypothetical protein
MTDLHSLLQEAAGPPMPAPTSQFADAVLAEGRRALRRRRIGRLSASSGLITAAVLTVLLTGSLIGRPAGPTQLVAYTGKQPAGFVLDKVPEHWHIQATDTGYLLLAPNNMKGISRDPSLFDGKVVVGLRLIVPPLTGAKVQVNGLPGVVFNNTPLDYTDEPQGRTLFVRQPTRRIVMPPCTKDEKINIKRDHIDLRLWTCGTAVRTPYLYIQVPGDLGWSNAQLVAFADSIHITKDSIITPS